MDYREWVDDTVAALVSKYGLDVWLKCTKASARANGEVPAEMAELWEKVYCWDRGVQWDVDFRQTERSQSIFGRFRGHRMVSG